MKNLIKVIEDTLVEEDFITFKALDGETALKCFMNIILILYYLI